MCVCVWGRALGRLVRARCGAVQAGAGACRGARWSPARRPRPAAAEATRATRFRPRPARTCRTRRCRARRGGGLWLFGREPCRAGPCPRPSRSSRTRTRTRTTRRRAAARGAGRPPRPSRRRTCAACTRCCGGSDWRRSCRQVRAARRAGAPRRAADHAAAPRASHALEPTAACAAVASGPQPCAHSQPKLCLRGTSASSRLSDRLWQPIRLTPAPWRDAAFDPVNGRVDLPPSHTRVQRSARR